MSHFYGTDSENKVETHPIGYFEKIKLREGNSPMARAYQEKDKIFGEEKFKASEFFKTGDAKDVESFTKLIDEVRQIEWSSQRDPNNEEKAQAMISAFKKLFAETKRLCV